MLNDMSELRGTFAFQSLDADPTRFGIVGQVGLRWVSGMSAIDGLAGTGFETINDNSAR